MLKFLMITCLYVYVIRAKPTQVLLRNTGRIIGGTTANAGDFPFAAAIYKQTSDSRYFCTGSLISDQWIITAGQCVENAMFFAIRLGSTSLTSNDPNAVIVTADEYFLHPDYNGFLNDLGLIKLRVPVSFNDFIKSVSVYASPPRDYLEVMTFGWGQISDDAAGPVEELNYVFLTTLSNTDCRSIFGDVITEYTVCAQGTSNEGICSGDLGSPLLRYFLDITPTTLLGVSSFISSNGCESTDPSGFTRIYPYKSWISNVTAIPTE